MRVGFIVTTCATALCAITTWEVTAVASTVVHQSSKHPTVVHAPASATNSVTPAPVRGVSTFVMQPIYPRMPRESVERAVALIRAESPEITNRMLISMFRRLPLEQLTPEEIAKMRAEQFSIFRKIIADLSVDALVTNNAERSVTLWNAQLMKDSRTFRMSIGFAPDGKISYMTPISDHAD
jgi:hypothetical protein